MLPTERVTIGVWDLHNPKFQFFLPDSLIAHIKEANDWIDIWRLIFVMHMFGIHPSLVDHTLGLMWHEHIAGQRSIAAMEGRNLGPLFYVCFRETLRVLKKRWSKRLAGNKALQDILLDDWAVQNRARISEDSDFLREHGSSPSKEELEARIEVSEQSRRAINELEMMYGRISDAEALVKSVQAENNRLRFHVSEAKKRFKNIETRLQMLEDQRGLDTSV